MLELTDLCPPKIQVNFSQISTIQKIFPFKAEIWSIFVAIVKKSFLNLEIWYSFYFYNKKEFFIQFKIWPCFASFG